MIFNPLSTSQAEEMLRRSTQFYFEFGDKPSWLFALQLRQRTAQNLIPQICSHSGTILTDPSEINKTSLFQLQTLMYTPIQMINLLIRKQSGPLKLCRAADHQTRLPTITSCLCARYRTTHHSYTVAQYEPMTTYHGGVEQKISLYADEVVLFISKPATSLLPQIVNIINQFSAFSGYKLNVTKSDVPHQYKL